MKVQLWSYNYDPEPSGIAPLSSAWARAMIARDHDVLVVSAHPHYPKPVWGQAVRPYRERRDGVPVLRLPLWIGRSNGLERVRQELTFASSLGLTGPLLPAADAVVAVSPNFPALAPAMLFSAVRRIPWVMWLQDILPDGAATTGLLPEGRLLDVARRFERMAYVSAARVVVISEAFERNLLTKGVGQEKLTRIYNPSPHAVPESVDWRPATDPRRLLVMGNIGYSQGLDTVVQTLERGGVLEETNSEFRIAGHGVAAADVEASISSDRVKMLGLLFGQDMEDELATTTIGFVTQRPDQIEFNLPSKLMNYLAHGIPVVAVVRPDSETARLVREARAGWVVDSSDPDALAPVVREALADPAELASRGRAAHACARRDFDPDQVAARFESVLRSTMRS